MTVDPVDDCTFWYTTEYLKSSGTFNWSTWITSFKLTGCYAARHPAYRLRYERTKQRLGRQRGAKVARVELARKLAEAIWHVLTKREPFAPAGPTMLLVT
jgi:hypothetical protein